MRTRTRSTLASIAAVAGLVLGPVVAPAASAADTTTFYVSPEGDDSASGRTATSPFATLARAQAAVREANADSDVDVVIAGGTYDLAQPLSFRTADGGRNGNTVTWRAADGATPVISGGRELSGWSDPDRDGIWQADLDTDTDFRQLYVDGTQAVRSNIVLDANRVTWTRDGFSIDPAALTGDLGAAWQKLQALPASQQQRLELRSRGSFTDRYAPFDSVQQSSATMKQPSWDNNTWGWDTISKPLPDNNHRTLRIQNALPLVTEANEWYFDIDAHTLYYRPANGVDPNTLDIVAPVHQTLVSISGDDLDTPVTGLRFEGLSFRYASFLTPNSDEGFADQQNGTFITGRLYALVDAQSRDLPTSDQRTYDGTEQAPLVRVIRQDDGGVYRYTDDGSAVASADLPRLIDLRDYPNLPLNDAQRNAWNAANPNAQKSDCSRPTYPSECIVFEAWRDHFEQMAAAVQVSAADGVTFEGNEFAHLGSVGLGIGNNDAAHVSGIGLGAKNISVVDNAFTDMAATAITAGGVSIEAHHPSSDASRNENLTITDNRIHRVGTDYYDASGILVTFVDTAEISHNELSDGPYDAIDTGFSWGIPDAGGNPTYQGRGSYIFGTRYALDDPTMVKDLHIAHNVMWDFKREGSDGGILYHLGSAPGSSWDANHVIGDRGYKLYFDEGTRHITARDNVLSGGGWAWAFANGFADGVAGPSFGQPNTTRDNLVDGTVVLGPGFNQGPWCYDSGQCDPADQGRWNNRVTTKSQIGVTELPLSAQKVIAEAGIRPEYRRSGDVVGQSRGIDVAISRDDSGAQIVTATAHNFGTSPLTDVQVTLSADAGVSLAPLTTAPTTLAPGATGTATWRVTGNAAITDSQVRASTTSTRAEWSGTSRDTVTRTLPVVLGGAVDADLTVAGFDTYLAPQAVQSGDDLALQAMGRDIGVGGDEYTTVYRKDGLSANGSITAQFTGAEGGFSKSGIAVRNDLSRTADAAMAEKSTGYAALLVEPGQIGLRYDKDGDGVIDTQVAQANVSARPLWLRLTRDGNTLTGSYSTDGAAFTALNTTVPLTGADDGAIDAGLVHSSANRTNTYGTDALSPSTARFSGLRIVNDSRSPVLTSTRPVDGVVGAAYDFRFTATNDPSFSLAQGTLPAGLTLGADGRLSGTPTTAGSFPVTVRATNDSGTLTQRVVLVVRATAPAAARVDATAQSTAPGLSTGTGVITVTNPTDHAVAYRVTVTDADGTTVGEQTLTTACGAAVSTRIAGLGAGTYAVRVVGDDGSAAATARFVVEDGPFTDLPAPWKSAGVGGATAAARGVDGDQIAILGGTSSDISGENNPRTDSFNTVYRENVLPADGVVQVTVTGQDAVADFTKSGLVIRDDLSVSTGGSRASGEAALVLTPTRGVRFTVENGDTGWFPTESGETTAWNVRQDIPVPVTLRLERKGGTTLVASYSTDGGATFTTVGTKTGFFVAGAGTVLDAGVLHATNGGVNGTAGSAAFGSFTAGAQIAAPEVTAKAIAADVDGAAEGSAELTVINRADRPTTLGVTVIGADGRRAFAGDIDVAASAQSVVIAPRLAAGTYTVMVRDRATGATGTASATISAETTTEPSPEPTPTPEPTDGPTPRPTGEPTPGPTGNPTGEPTTAPSPTPTGGAGQPDGQEGQIGAPSESALTADLRGGITAPAIVDAGDTITVNVPSAAVGSSVASWLFSQPTALGTTTVGADRSIRVTIPADAPAGEHRLAVTAADGTVIGWTPITVRVPHVPLASTGAELPGVALLLGLLLCAAGAVVVSRRRSSGTAE